MGIYLLRKKNHKKIYSCFFTLTTDYYNFSILSYLTVSTFPSLSITTVYIFHSQQKNIFLSFFTRLLLTITLSLYSLFPVSLPFPVSLKPYLTFICFSPLQKYMPLFLHSLLCKLLIFSLVSSCQCLNLSHPIYYYIYSYNILSSSTKIYIHRCFFPRLCKLFLYYFLHPCLNPSQPLHYYIYRLDYILFPRQL